MGCLVGGLESSRMRGRRGFGVWVWRKSRALVGIERLRKRRRVFRVRRGGEKMRMKNKAPLNCRNLACASSSCDFECSGGRKEMVKRSVFHGY